jgi:cell division protein ZipA
VIAFIDRNRSRRRLVFIAELPLIAALSVGCGSRVANDERVRTNGDNAQLYVATPSETEARIRGALPTKGSEDVSNLLVALDPVAKRADNASERDYLPDLAVDWVVDVRFRGDPPFDTKRVDALFGADWRKLYGRMTIYGLEPDAGRWTYLVAADGPKKVTQLKIAWNYVDPLDRAAEPDAANVYVARLDAVRTAVKPLGAVELTASLAPDEASRRARQLRELRSKLDYSPTLILRAPKGEKYGGKPVWDVMLCLGLKWGDMDIFHWLNSSTLGDDFYFSVWTSTPPGYFLPEQIASDKVRVDDLVFSFSTPRCERPAEVFESMIRAVQYAKKRLGGTVITENGAEANIPAIRRKIESVEQELKANGFRPGDGNALRLF